MEKINEKGITLIALTITIIVLLILLSITVATGGNQIKETKKSKLEVELQMIEHALLEEKTKIEYTRGEYPGTKIEYTEAKELADEMGISLKDTDNYYLLEKAEDFKEIGIENSEYIYIVNYKTGEVLNKDIHFDSSGEAAYTYPGK